MMRFSADTSIKYTLARIVLASAAALIAWTDAAYAASDACVRLDSFREGQPIVTEIFLAPARPFSAESEIKCGIAWRNDLAANKRFDLEEGTYNKRQYFSFYSDGGGRLQGAPNMDFFANRDRQHSAENWSTTCPVRYQPVEIQWCGLWKRDLWIILSQDGVYRAMVGRRDRGARNVSVQVDKQPPIEAVSNEHFTAEQTAEILRQIRQGKEVTTKFISSSGKIETQKQSLFAANEALDFLNWTVVSIAKERRPFPRGTKVSD